MRRYSPLQPVRLGLRHDPEPEAARRRKPSRLRQSAGDLIGLTATELVARFGAPALQVREGTGLKLQFRGRSLRARRLSLSGAERAGIAASVARGCAAPLGRRHQSGAGCIAALSRRAEAAPTPTARRPRSPGRRSARWRLAPAPASARSPLLPAAIRQLRTIRSRPIRLIGEPANISRNAASSSASRSASRGAASSARGRKARLAAARFGEPVPRAHRQAIVAAVDAVADRLAEFVRDRPLVLDRQVGNAAPRIDPVRRREGLRRAGVEAARAAAAMRPPCAARPGASSRRGVDHAEEQPAAMLAADEVGVLALPADPGRLAPAAFPSPARCRRTP